MHHIYSMTKSFKNCSFSEHFCFISYFVNKHYWGREKEAITGFKNSKWEACVKKGSQCKSNVEIHPLCWRNQKYVHVFDLEFVCVVSLWSAWEIYKNENLEHIFTIKNTLLLADTDSVHRVCLPTDIDAM